MGETDGDEMDPIPATLQHLIAGSHVVAAGRRARAALSNSVPAGGSDCLITAAQNSYLYRWLTTEPEPEVIVIDLRETYTVGPFIRILDAAVDRLEPYWHGSRLRGLLVAVESAVATAAGTRIGQFIAGLFAPPEPPERSDKPGWGGTAEQDSPESSEEGNR